MIPFHTTTSDGRKQKEKERKKERPKKKSVSGDNCFIEIKKKVKIEKMKINFNYLEISHLSKTRKHKIVAYQSRLQYFDIFFFRKLNKNVTF